MLINIFEFESSILDNPRNDKNPKKASGSNDDCNMDNNTLDAFIFVRETYKEEPQN